MPLDPQIVYDQLEKLQESVNDICLHQKEQNGFVARNIECIDANTRRLERHDQILSKQYMKLGVLETHIEHQREFEAQAEQEFDWTRDQILDLLVKVLPWIGVLGLVAERLLR